MIKFIDTLLTFFGDLIKTFFNSAFASFYNSTVYNMGFHNKEPAVIRNFGSIFNNPVFAGVKQFLHIFNLDIPNVVLNSNFTNTVFSVLVSLFEIGLSVCIVYIVLKFVSRLIRVFING